MALYDIGFKQEWFIDFSVILRCDLDQLNVGILFGLSTEFDKLVRENKIGREVNKLKVLLEVITRLVPNGFFVEDTFRVTIIRIIRKIQTQRPSGEKRKSLFAESLFDDKDELIFLRKQGKKLREENRNFIESTEKLKEDSQSEINRLKQNINIMSGEQNTLRLAHDRLIKENIKLVDKNALKRF